MPVRPNGQGFTLIELMVAIAVLAIFITIGIPSFLDTIEKHRVASAIEKVYADLHLARSQAIKSNQRQFVSLTAGAGWCYGIDDTAAGCDCSANACVMDGVPRNIGSADFTNTNLAVDVASIEFEPRRGLPQDANGAPLAGNFTISTANGRSAQVTMNAIGRLSICSDDPRMGYPACP